MTYKEAKEIADKGNPPFVNDRLNYMRCVGFIEAVHMCTPLVEALETIASKEMSPGLCGICYEQTCDEDCPKVTAKTALSDYKREVLGE